MDLIDRDVGLDLVEAEHLVEVALALQALVLADLAQQGHLRPRLHPAHVDVGAILQEDTVGGVAVMAAFPPHERATHVRLVVPLIDGLTWHSTPAMIVRLIDHQLVAVVELQMLDQHRRPRLDAGQHAIASKEAGVLAMLAASQGLPDSGLADVDVSCIQTIEAHLYSLL